ncbi:hypothetical protein ACFL4U_00685 [Candidatus Neomarinimicrobiota bacterium]
MKLIHIVLAGLLILACSDRERSNPLDPGNPETHGAPTGFQVVANRDTAWLSWNPVEVEGLERYLLYRSIGTDPLRLYHRMGPDSTLFTDINLKYDSTYVYALEAKTTMGLSRRTEPDTLIPGLHNFLVNDKSASIIWSISFDGRHRLEHLYIDWPDALTYHPVSQRVWIASNAFWDKAVYHMDARFTQIERVSLKARPIDITAETSTGNVYVLQILPDRIQRISSAGDTTGSISVPAEVYANAMLAYDETGNLLWFCNPISSTSGAVYYRRPYLTSVSWEYAAQVGYPRKMIADPIQGGCWVATDAGLAYLAPDGEAVNYLVDMRIRDISINPDFGDCYFVARSFEAHDWSVGYFHLVDGPINGLYLDIVLSSPMMIQAMTADQKAGFLLGPTEDGEILRYNAYGQLIGSLDGFGPVLEFALE